MTSAIALDHLFCAGQPPSARGHLRMLVALEPVGGLREARPPLLERLSRAPIERFEAMRLLKPPASSRTRGAGASRTTHDEYSDGCWLNDISGLDYDAADLLSSGVTACICGG